MAFLIKLGSMTIVTPTAAEAVDTFDKFMAQNQRSVPIIRTFDGAVIDIASLREAEPFTDRVSVSAFPNADPSATC